jgi:hypothetical protein
MRRVIGGNDKKKTRIFRRLCENAGSQIELSYKVPANYPKIPPLRDRLENDPFLCNR